MKINKLANVIFFFFLVFGSFGCARMVETSDELGGVQTGNRWGIIRYPKLGKDDAIKKMTDYCAPLSYKISTVDNRSQLVSHQGQLVRSSQNVTRFECVP